MFFLTQQQKSWEGCGWLGLGIWLLHEPITVARGDMGVPLQLGSREELFPNGRRSKLIKKKMHLLVGSLLGWDLVLSPPQPDLLLFSHSQLSLGFPQLPTAPILHPWGPCPGQVSGQPSGRAAA